MVNILKLGLLLLPGYQWLDAAGSVDYLNNHSNAFVSTLGLPAEVVEQAPIMEWHYISSDLQPVNASSGPPQTPTTTYATCPKLDYLVVPGPDPSLKLSNETIRFLQDRYADPDLKGILLICTGSIVVSQSGILDGLEICSNKYVMREWAGTGLLNKNVKWVGDRRWHVDGKVWSSGGITAGIDLAAQFAKVHFAKEIVDAAKEASEHVPLPDQPDPFAYMLEGVQLP